MRPTTTSSVRAPPAFCMHLPTLTLTLVCKLS